MPSPFPGMDPFIERPAIWPDFHDRFVSNLCEAVQPLLKPKYGALSQNRDFVTQHERSVYPDVSIIKIDSDANGGVAVATETSQRLTLKIEHDDFREPFLEIIDFTNGGRVVTTIEVLSPDNKRPGPGLRSYLRKRREYWNGGANVVEIDLLRDGTRHHKFPPTEHQAVLDSPYLVSVLRRKPKVCDYYGFGLKQPLPRIEIPLAKSDPAITVPLQPILGRTWESGAYPGVLRYDQLPHGSLSEADAAFCRERLMAAGIVPAA